MGNQGFQGEARAKVQCSIVQERNKAANSYLSETTQGVHHRQTYGGIPG